MSETVRIASRDNARLVHARRVRAGQVPDRIFIEGRRLVAEALRSAVPIKECFVSDGFRESELIDAVAGQTPAIAVVSERLFGSIADTDSPQGIVVIAKRPQASWHRIESAITSGPLPIVVFLNEINNPSNLGAILRTAEAAGVAGVVVSENSVDVFSPKALRAAMGSSFRLPVLTGISFEDVLGRAVEMDLQTTAADISGEVDYAGIEWNRPRLLIFGSEAHGLCSAELEKIDEKIYIPMENGVESLNLGVSAGIILFEAKRSGSPPVRE